MPTVVHKLLNFITSLTITQQHYLDVCTIVASWELRVHATWHGWVPAAATWVWIPSFSLELPVSLVFNFKYSSL